MSQSQTPPPSAAANIQANLVRASKFADGEPRDWTAFFFFRIMPDAEIAATSARIDAFLAQPDSSKGREILLDFANPGLVNAGLPIAEASRCIPGLASPTFERFRHWLSALVSGDRSGLVADAISLEKLDLHEFTSSTSALWDFPGDPPQVRTSWRKDPVQAATDLSKLFMDQSRLVHSVDAGWAGQLSNHGSADAAAMRALEGSLVGVARHEILRQGIPAFSPGMPAIRSEAAIDDTPLELTTYDPVGVNIAFTWTGLKALAIDEATLASFPEPFRQGMASRARRLRDTGPSAPAGWDGSFGLPRMHGYFTGGFLVGGESRQAPELLWRQLRADIAAFNAPESKEALELRAQVGALFRPFGLEIIQVELGQDPYDIVENKEETDKDRRFVTSKRPQRVEHFGFRDGLSQPFADLKLRASRPGGGTPSRNRTWAPVAPGELFLDLPDEDGGIAQAPINASLRRHGTYVAFRKLEQDVVGFRSFVARQALGDTAKADHLAAGFVGRWPSGTPLVLSPDADRAVAGGEDKLNDFLYATDDPGGAKCPLGAHVRRANPRDVGGKNEVRRHRLLRRGVAYGGSLLPADSFGDGEARGLLFLGLSTRIDLQFEVIQADWLNSGEFLGQVGLGRCPLTGANDGRPLDAFVGTDSAESVTGIPRFVTCRGGDYFFAPGIEALKAIAAGDVFTSDQPPYDGLSMGDSRTQGLFDKRRLKRFGEEITGSYACPHLRKTIAIDLPAEDPPLDTAGNRERMVFVGRYKDVVETLSDRVKDGRLEFSVEPYHVSAQQMTRGYDLLISTDAAGPTAPARERLRTVLDAAWATVVAERSSADQSPASDQIWRDIADLSRKRLDGALLRCGPAGRIDLIDDLAVPVAYAVVRDIYGVSAPDWMSELAAALPFGKQRLSELPADWLKALKSSDPGNPGLISLQTWSAVMLGDTIANLPAAGEARPLSRQAGAEMLSHIDQTLARARARAKSGPVRVLTMVDAFVANADQFVGRGKGKKYKDIDAYFREASVILAEMTANTIAATPSAFATLMRFLLESEISPGSILDLKGAAAASPELLEQVVYECDRLNPVLPILQRLCKRATDLPSGTTVSAGDRVAVLLTAAGLDPEVFPNPFEFSLDRPAETYLMFGAPDRRCWGQKIAQSLLTQCLAAAMTLKDLRGVAGEAGAPRNVFGLTIGLPARFTPSPVRLVRP